ncbi:type VI secretion system protein TssA [Oceanicella sp. SM1341]|uniref:type VI secretion system protein TssA n=1 Tax=Oceanicella sp. SM1341 TaxID=1548889 RepID=UPI001E3A6645|nr:type VI secretion system protein TssA [Oceanicella sp. SM1341]
MFDTDEMLQSLDDAAPCGENLEYDAEYTALELANQPTEERVIGDAVLSAEDPDYEEVAALALALLGRTKDLRVAAVLANAALRTGGLPGFARVLGYVRGCLELYWEHVHPQLDADDEDDPTMRVNAVLGLAEAGTVLRSLRLAPLTDSRSFGRISLRDMLVAEGELAPAEDERAPDPQAIDAAFADTPPERLTEIAAAVQAVQDHARAIGGIFDAHIGAEGPDLAPLVKLARDIARRLPEQAATAPEAEASPGAELPAGDGPAPAPAPGAPRAVPGAIETPQDVVATLDRIVDYYRRREPSSPLPLLLMRARRLVSADFMTVIRDMAPLGLENVALIGGLEEEAPED